jgi:CRP-like cAMP-binding protein
MFELLHYLQSVSHLSSELIDRIEDAVQFQIRRLRRKDILLRPKQICNNIYFVESGILRVFYTKDQKEITSSFAMQGQICVSAASFFKQRHGTETIQAVKNSTVRYIDHRQYIKLCSEFPEFNTLSRVLLENCQADREERLEAMWMQPAENRYQWLMGHSPEIVEKISGKDLCSYLGITKEFLSRIKNTSSSRR